MLYLRAQQLVEVIRLVVSAIRKKLHHDYKGQKVKFYGRVIQVLEGDREVDIRLATKKF